MQIQKKIILGYDVMMMSPILYDTQHGVVINRAKFDACAYSSFRGVETDRHTGRIALYVLDL